MRRRRWRGPLKYVFLAALAGGLIGGAVLGMRHYIPNLVSPAAAEPRHPQSARAGARSEPLPPPPVAKPKKKAKRSKGKPADQPETIETVPAAPSRPPTNQLPSRGSAKGPRASRIATHLADLGLT